ncbi:HIT domain-containing protein [Candidatus Pelagibacter sp.]|jgi:histidine triad (HIT) family protein|nr:HIT domain-containing protein [Candidatus Pelagibacter sp.]|tara:strand:+ start:294 stop:659 length:366 start_codon:yes stop_codon:yes gene_type:complete
MSYDKNNIFAKILRKEIPCKKIFENEYILSFYDINPQKKIHALVIPKGEYINLDDFNDKASDQEIIALSKAITEVSKILGISTDVGKGYRALTNLNEHGGQEVPHLHFHLFGGEKIGKMVE